MWSGRVFVISATALFCLPLLAEDKPAPIQIGGEKQLFIDELFFADKRGVARVMNQPVKDHQPVLTADKDNPWEANRISAGNSVVDDNGEIRIYYDAIAPSPGDRSRWLCCAVSRDGIHFEKPKLGIIPFEGRSDTNIVWPPKQNPSHEPGNVFVDTNPKCPAEERYKMVSGSLASATGTTMAVSADGLHWKAYEKSSYPQADTTIAAFFDNRIGRYVGWVRVPGNGRAVGRCEFDDPRDWGAATRVFHADEEDVRYLDKALFNGMDYYCGGVNAYRPAPGIYFGFPAAYYHFHREASLRRGRGGTRSPGNDGNIEAQLITSRDGIHWNRPDRGRPFIPRGPDGSWDCGMTYVCGGSNLVYRDNEVWIYYSAQPFTHGDYSLAEKEALGSVMRAVLRLDGFVSVDTGFEPGEFTTPPLVFAGTRLELNVDTGGGGSLRVELQDAEGHSLEGFSLADCDLVNGNYIRYPVSWKGQTDLSQLAGRPVRMKVTMRATKLYAFQFPQRDTAASGVFP